LPIARPCRREGSGRAVIPEEVVVEDLGQMGALIVRHRISLDAATRIVWSERGEVEVPVWIARRNGETCSREVAVDAVRDLARRQGLLPVAAACGGDA